MHKLLKYLKKSTIPIIVVIGLLVLQAYCDLSLPAYTSDIVDVGIQQGGIKTPLPKVLRESQMNKIQLVVNPENKDMVLDSYRLLSKAVLSETEYSTYLEEYPILSEENVYILILKEDQISDMLIDVVSKALFMISMGDMDIQEILSQLPEDQKALSLATMEEQLSEIPPFIIEQSAISMVKSEYTAVGIDMGKLQTDYIKVAGIKMLSLALQAMIATIAVGFLSARIAATLGKDLRSKVFKKVVAFSNSEFDKFSTASLITRSTNDIQQVQMTIVMLLRIVIYSPILAVGGIIKVLNTNTSMVWIIALAVALIMSLVGCLFVIAMPKFKLMQKLLDKLNLVTREILTGLPVIRAFHREDQEEKRFDLANTDLTRINLFVQRVMAFMMPTMMLIMNGITILIIWKGAEGIDLGQMQVGDLMAFIQYTMQIIISFLMLSMLSIMLPRASVSASRIVEVLNTEILIHDPKEAKKFIEDKDGYVEFENVSFRYPKAEGDVLSNITFTARPGETTAIIGSTGSGKSTLINLIPRFFDVTAGTIKVGGIDIREVMQSELRDKIGYVPQKGVLFSGTIDSNIRYGRQDANHEEIKRAARIAQAVEFIEEKSDKYNTAISQGGNNVSGGQKQRLSIARAIAKDPDIYIFDDSFSALDYKTDVALRKALKSEIKKSTVIIVAQRISTILQADQILVLDDGKIVGKGTHKELLKNCEVYQQIALSQLSKEELANE